MQKLIRDKYVDIIEAERLSNCDEEALPTLLIEKLSEELTELDESEWQDVNEYGDVLEVLYAIAKFNGVSIEDINHARIVKAEKYGKFNEGLLLNLDKPSTKDK